MAENGRSETDMRRTRLWMLTQTLKAHGYLAEMAESAPSLSVPGSSGVPLSVCCDRRSECAGEMWFFLDGAPMAPADDAHMHEAIVAIKGRLPVADAQGSVSTSPAIAEPDTPQTDSERLRGYISDLDRAVSRRPELACGVVERADCGTVLNVIRVGSARRFVEITVVEGIGGAWFAWAGDGKLIGPVLDPDAVAYAVSCELGALARS